MMMYFVLGDLGWHRMCMAQNGRKLAVQEEVESNNDKRAPPLSSCGAKLCRLPSVGVIYLQKGIT